MKVNPKIIIPTITIFILALFLLLWVDDLAQKQMGLLGYNYELLKIILHSSLAYLITKYINEKFKLAEKIKSIAPKTIFLTTFLILNSYIICQYTSRVIFHKIINQEIRSKINVKTEKLGPAGCGYESDSISYLEFKELTKYRNLPDIPESAENIFVYDWYEIDYNRTIKFNVSPNFNLGQFYKDTPSILNDIEKLQYEFTTSTLRPIKLDTTKFIRYKWQIRDL